MFNRHKREDTGPQKLSKKEREHPLLVLYQLFDYASLSHLKEHLWQWLKLTVTNGYTKKYLQYNDRDRIITLYEFIEKLIEASHVIYSERKEELRKLHHRLLEAELDEEEKESPELSKLQTAETNFSSHVTQYIIESMKPAFIFHLGTVHSTQNLWLTTFHPQIRTVNYLLIVLPSKPSRPLHEYERRLQNKYDNKLIAIVKCIKEVNNLRKKGNRFFANHCSEEKCFYSSGKSTLEEPLVILEKDLSQFNVSFAKAESFLFGSKFFLDQENYSLAAFMLHQSAELALSAILHLDTGHKEQTHNLNKLLSYCRLWVPSVSALFETKNEEEHRQFQLLQKAYNDGRYKQNFPITKSEIDLIYKKVMRLHQTITELTTSNSDA